MKKKISKPKISLEAKEILGFARKNWYLLALLMIFILGFWVRSFPAKYNELQALDPFYMYRMSKYAAEHGLTLPAHDDMRYYPDGVDPYNADFMGPTFIPASIYILMTVIGISIPYIKFAIIFPAVLGSISVVLMFFLAKEIFDKKAAIIAAFLFAMIPAFITRTSAGFFEKESLGAVFIMLSMLFFIKACKDKSWLYAILSGISLAVLASSWGGTRLVFILVSLYAIVLLLINRDVDKLTVSLIPMAILGTLLTQLYPYHISLFSTTMLPIFAALGLLLIRVGLEKLKLVKEENLFYVTPGVIVTSFVVLLLLSVFYAPAETILNDIGRYFLSMIGISQHGALASTVAEQIPGNWGSITGSSGANYTSLPLATVGSIWIYAFLGGIVLIIVFVQNIYKGKDINLLQLIPLIWILFSVGTIFYMVRLVIFFAFPAVLLSGYFFSYLFNQLLPRAKTHINKMNELFYLAVVSIVGSAFFFIARETLSDPIIGWLTWNMLGLLLFNIGILYFLFEYLRRDSSPDLIFALLIIYASLLGIFWYIFSSLEGMIAELSLIIFPSLFFIGLFVTFFVKKKINKYTVVIALLVVALAYVSVINLSNAYNYGNAMGPSICFPTGEECLIFNEDGTYEYNLNGQPWYQAMTYMKDNTTEDSSILSWWDFGYWFQTRGMRPSIADGGNINATVDEEIAKWFTSPPGNWSNFEKWLEEHKVTHILMDYTLPGKYGAISRIASEGKETKGMQQFPFRRTLQQENKTIYEFGVSYTDSGIQTITSIYIPMSEAMIDGTPQLIVTQNGQVVQQAFINNYCSDYGLLQLDNKENALDGCVAITSFGVFYIPGDVMDTIFTNLMFMNGAGLPVKPVFTSDNGIIKIYETEYYSGYNETAE